MSFIWAECLLIHSTHFTIYLLLYYIQGFLIIAWQFTQNIYKNKGG